MPKGVYVRRLRPLAERLWDKVDKQGPIGDHRPDLGPCWLWTGALTKGYGVIGRSRRGSGLLRAHRVAYELLVGPIPAGRQLDHLCRNRACVNPDHLEPVTPAENTRRGQTGLHMREKRDLRTHCKHGHPFDERNKRTRPDGAIVCRRCSVLAQQRYVAAKRAVTA